MARLLCRSSCGIYPRQREVYDCSSSVYLYFVDVEVWCSVAEMKMLRQTSEYKLRDRIRNEYIPIRCRSYYISK